MKVLIVYENVPESTDMYIVEANESELADLKLAHGNYVNACEEKEIEDAMQRIFIRLGSDEYTTADDCAACNLDVAAIAKWNGSNVVIKEPVNIAESSIELVVITGFLM